jgi:type II secretory ATPase GspE/PulE/Tfp pilus assembly ATPase PilB-like protein
MFDHPSPQNPVQQPDRQYGDQDGADRDDGEVERQMSAPVHRLKGVSLLQDVEQTAETQNASRVFLNALGPLEGSEAENYLAFVAQHLKAFLQRLQLAGWAPGITAAESLPEGSRWYRPLILEGVDPLRLAAMVRSEFWFPVAGEDGNTLLDHFCDQGMLRIRDVRKVERSAGEKNVPFWSEAVELGLINESDFVDAIAAMSGVPRSSGTPRFSRPVLQVLPPSWVQSFDMVPLRRTKGVIHVACSGNPAPLVVERLREMADEPVEIGLATRAEIESWRAAWLEKWTEQFGEPDMDASAPVALQASLEGLCLESGVSAVVVVQKLIDAAHACRATDIHLEPTPEGGRVRYRIDGMCQDALNLEMGVYREVVGRIKILADLDVTERRRPQDGHFSLTIDGRNSDMRISTVPAKGGEKVAIRLADPLRISGSLDSLGPSALHLQQLRDLIARPYGMVLATGPVGSGKTTTLYSCLLELDRTQCNVMSIEDPVEVVIDQVTQLEVNYALGFTFVAGLRALLRQDPDTILVGEIRDEETARISVRASMTGLRVFSTLHTNDSVGAITALRNFNLSQHLLASSLQGVIAQRLVRRLCGNCRRGARPNEDEIETFRNWGVDPKSRVFRPKGCPACLHTGFRGRVGVFEVFTVDNETREMVLNGQGAGVVRRHARQNGMTTLQEDGLNKVAAGQTTLAELRRVLDFSTTH